MNRSDNSDCRADGVIENTMETTLTETKLTIHPPVVIGSSTEKTLERAHPRENSPLATTSSDLFGMEKECLRKTASESHAVGRCGDHPD